MGIVQGPVAGITATVSLLVHGRSGVCSSAMPSNRRSRAVHPRRVVVVVQVGLPPRRIPATVIRIRPCPGTRPVLPDREAADDSRHAPRTDAPAQGTFVDQRCTRWRPSESFAPACQRFVVIDEQKHDVDRAVLRGRTLLPEVGSPGGRGTRSIDARCAGAGLRPAGNHDHKRHHNSRSGRPRR